MRNHATFRKSFDFGKINYNGTGRRYSAKVNIEYRLEERDGRLFWEFSACGSIGQRCGGQCLDTIAEFVHNATFRAIHGLWKRNHLNGMTAGSPAQEAAKADFKRDPAKATWYWYDSSDITENTDNYGRHVTDDEATAKAAKTAGHYPTKNTGDYHDQLAIYLAKRGLYTDCGCIYKGRPYKYGEAWLVTGISAEDKTAIRALLGITAEDEAKAEVAARGEVADESAA